jgi:hypothetical protein
VAYIEGDVPILGLSHFVCAHVLREEPYHSISMLYEGGNKVLRLPKQAYLLCSCDQLIVQLNTLENACHSILGPPHTHGRAQWEAAGQSPSQPQWDTGTGVAFWDIMRVEVHTILTVPWAKPRSQNLHLCRVPSLVLPPREVYQLPGEPSRTHGGGERTDRKSDGQVRAHADRDTLVH